MPLANAADVEFWADHTLPIPALPPVKARPGACPAAFTVPVAIYILVKELNLVCCILSDFNLLCL